MNPPLGQPVDRSADEHPDAHEDLLLTFIGGTDLMHAPQKISEGMARRMINLYYPRETGIPRTRPGTTSHTAGAVGDAITAVHVFRAPTGITYNCFTVINSTKQELWYQTGTAAPVLISDDLGSLLKPYMTTYNGVLLVAIAGQYILEWQGFVSGVPAHASATCTFTDTPATGETITIGTTVWTWRTAGTEAPPNELPLGTGGTAQLRAESAATNLAAAINRDSFLYEAVVHVGDPTVCHISARRVGSAGNVALVDGMSNATVSGNLISGVNGVHLDAINTSSAPKPGFFFVDWNQRLVASGDPDDLDRVNFSAPDDQWQWATGSFGGGETFRLGVNDGMDIVAIHPHLGEVVVHKSGQGREIYRVNTKDPDPATWTSTVKKFFSNTAALNCCVVASVTDMQLFLDSRGMSSIKGTDTYDELAVSGVGVMLGDELKNVSATESFFVVNPDENYILVFPAAGRECWALAYGSGRWTRWEFALDTDITCGSYSDEHQTILFGTESGAIFKLDDTIATDDGANFTTEIVTRALGDGQLKMLLVKQVLLDWKNSVQGEGIVDLEINNGKDPYQPLFTFTVEDSELLLRDTEFIHLEDATMLLMSTAFGRKSSFSQGAGELVALRIRLTEGAFHLNSATVRVAYHGRVGK